jgi:hypothetical protein
LYFGNFNNLIYSHMPKKILAIISVISLLLTFVPAQKIVLAAPAKTVGFDGISSQAAEGELTYIKFQTSFSLEGGQYVDVRYTISGTAHESDFYFHDGSGVARIRENELSFPLYGIDEGGLELDETVVVTITSVTHSAGENVSIDQNNKVHTHKIVDYNGLPKLSFLYSTDSASETGVDGNFVVYLSRPAAADVTFQWTFTPVGAATAVSQATVINGYSFPPDVLIAGMINHSEVIPAGQNSITIPLGIQNDNLFEGNEIVDLFLRPNPDNAVVGSVDRQLFSIVDNDEPTISFQTAGSSGQESVGNVNFSVVLSNPSIYNTVFSLAVDQANSSARWGGVDWNLPVPIAAPTILAGSTSANAQITVVDDNEQEGSEVAVISLTNVQHNNETLGRGANSSYTYTIIDNDTTVAPPANPPANPPATPPVNPPVVPPGVCPTLSSGDMVKVANKPAIYVVNRFNKIMYFPSGDEFKSWNEGEGYGGYVTVTQDCFDNGLSTPIAPPAGVNFRPGSYVIKKENTNQLYVILPNNAIAKISDADAKALYGTNYKVMTVKFIFWSNYVNAGADVSGKVHSGMLVRKDGKVWYVDGNSLREVPAAQMAVNRFKTAFIRTVPASYLAGLATGVPISGQVVEYTNRTQL